MKRSAVVVLLVLALAGCSSADEKATKSAQPAKFEPGPCLQTPEPTPGFEKARCGTLVVPEDRSKENGRTIRLAVAVVPAISPTPAADPMLFVTGGPGNSAILDAHLITTAELNRDRDAIFMSARGTWGSKPDLSCPELAPVEESLPGVVYDAPSTGESYVAAGRKCRERILAQEKGTDLNAYNTSEAVADYAELRTALGIKEWNVLGHSYGSDLTQVMMRERPEGIRSVLLEGIVPPARASVAAWTWASMKRALDNVFRTCAEEQPCAARYPRLSETFTEQVNKLEANPVRTRVTFPDGDSVDVVLDGGALVNTMVGFMNTPADIPLVIDELAKGRPQRIAERWAAKWAPLPPGAPAPFAHGFHYSVICSEWVPFFSKSEELDRARQEFPEYPESVLAQGPQLPFLRDTCGVWDVRKAPDSIREATKSSLRTLIIAGTFDPATGEQWSDDIAKGLSNSTVLKFKGVSHGAFAHPASGPCGPDVVRSFFNNPDSPDTACVASIKPPPFKIG